MKSIYIFIFVIGILWPLVTTKHVDFFRKDYEYNEEFDAFYKLHSNSQGLSWTSAFLSCYDEGATMFYPKAKNEWELIKNLPGAVAGDQNVTKILIGVHDKFGLGEFITVDGHSTESPLHVQEPDTSHRFSSGFCVYLDIYTGSYKVGPCVTKDLEEPLGYVCKKVKNTTETCPTIDRDYTFVKSSGKCYKINSRYQTWTDAMRTCFMEGGILAVIRNADEANSLKELLRELRPNTELRYHVGIYRMTPGEEMYTVTGEDFEGMYKRSYDNSNYDCGAIYYYESELYTVTTDCMVKQPFICEMEINTRM